MNRQCERCGQAAAVETFTPASHTVPRCASCLQPLGLDQFVKFERDTADALRRAEAAMTSEFLDCPGDERDCARCSAHKDRYLHAKANHDRALADLAAARAEGG